VLLESTHNSEAIWLLLDSMKIFVESIEELIKQENTHSPNAGIVRKDFSVKMSKSCI
jgi:hypothetical protein